MWYDKSTIRIKETPEFNNQSHFPFQSLPFRISGNISNCRLLLARYITKKPDVYEKQNEMANLKDENRRFPENILAIQPQLVPFNLSFRKGSRHSQIK